MSQNFSHFETNLGQCVYTYIFLVSKDRGSRLFDLFFLSRGLCYSLVVHEENLAQKMCPYACALPSS